MERVTEKRALTEPSEPRDACLFGGARDPLIADGVDLVDRQSYIQELIKDATSAEWHH